MPADETRKQRLERLRALKSKNKGAFSEDDDDNVDIYDEVDNNQFREYQQKRIREDDFVVDDDGQGYIDNGAYEWDAEHNYYSDDDDDGGAARGSKGKKRKVTEEKPEKRSDADITAMFKKVSSGAVKKQRKEITKEDEEFFDDLLEEMDDGLEPVPEPAVPKRKHLVPPVPSISGSSSSTETPIRTSVQVPSSPLMNPATSSSTNAANPDISMDDLIDEAMGDDEIDEELSLKAITPSTARPNELLNVRASAPKPVVAPVAPVAPVVVTPTTTTTSTTTAATRVSPPPKPTSLDELKKDLPDMVDMGSMTGPSVLGDVVEVESFFWTDYAETASDIFFFGKAKLANSAEIVNTSLLVRGAAREVYFLPRKMKFSEPEVPVEMADVYLEVSQWYEKNKGANCNMPFRAKSETMKYCFDKQDIPREAEYLKALLPFDINSMPTSGETFSHVFGVSTPIFEQVVLSQRIKGPCWLELKNATKRTSKYTHSNLELEVPSPSCLTPLSKQDPMPPLTIMSLSIRTILNPAKDTQDIVALSATIFSNAQVDPTVADAKKGTRCSFTIVRPFSGKRFSDDLTQVLTRKGKFAPHTREGSNLSHIDGELLMKNSEYDLLLEFAKRCKHFDPDIILGHELEQTHLPILLQRCREILPEKSYKEISRLPKSWPKYISYAPSVRNILGGRLICDLYNTMGQSLTTACDTWSLSDMCDKYLDGMIRPEWEIDISRFKERDAPLPFLSFLKNSEDDTLRTMRIATEIQMLPLTKQLTDIAGNSWSGTLTGSRVQRNEFILMHEFTRKGYIVPEKAKSDKHGSRKEEQLGEGEILPTKAKYQGGKVLDPKTGLYRSIVMVLDFNSLYPSIVREFNICFTTIPYGKYINGSTGDVNDDEDVELPDGSVEQGIFPKLIEYLVETRKAIKSEMKKTNDPRKLKQFDIKQLALKLTANSMYGCLGFASSRFYALPLATVITQKGREILTSTCDLALSNNLQVVYGDTDSVMVDTNVLWVGEANENACAELMEKLTAENVGVNIPFDQRIQAVRQLVKAKQMKDAYDQAIEIGNKFKGTVNEQYKTLEIDIDNVFKTLLLNAKKKYAAVDLKAKPLVLNQVLGKSASNGQLVKFSESALKHLGLEYSLKEEQVIKGLDMVRRGFCELSKQASRYVLSQILSDQSVGDVVDNIRDYLRKLADDARNGKHDLLLYVIRMKLNKSVDEYNNASRDQPHVQVALRKKAKSELVGKNEVVSYIIAENPEGPSLPLGKRAYTRREMLEQNMKPDIDYYLSKQILVPLERICNAVHGLSMSDLAACLGVHVNQSRHIEHYSNNKSDYVPLEVTLSDEQKFQHVSPFSVKCSCGESFEFKGLNKFAGKIVTDNGLTCPHCNNIVSQTRVNAQLECAIRQEIAKYYNGWLCCSECNTRTRQISVYGRRCLKKQDDKIKCTGIMTYEYSSKRLYYQLQYYYSLFDVTKAKANSGKSTDSEKASDDVVMLDENEIRARADLNSVRFSKTLTIVDKYIKDCGRAFVDMRDIFGMAAA